jgi:hypothetical protein
VQHVALQPSDCSASHSLTCRRCVQLIVLFAQYFAKVKEKYVRENFVLIYELLDECCDHGVPQITEPSVLKEYIFQKGTFLKEKKDPADDMTLQVCGNNCSKDCNDHVA